jgi:hypothetical protein
MTIAELRALKDVLFASNSGINAAELRQYEDELLNHLEALSSVDVSQVVAGFSNDQAAYEAQLAEFAADLEEISGAGLVLLAEQTVTAASVTSIDFTLPTGWTGNDLKELEIRANIIGGNTGTYQLILVRLNNDAGTNYPRISLTSTSASVTASSGTTETGFVIGFSYLTNVNKARIAIISPQAGQKRHALTDYRYARYSASNADHTQRMESQIWNNTSDNITSINIVSATANMILAGSYVAIYARK